MAESPPGTSQCFTVSIVADDVRENDETIDLLLLSDDIIVDETSIFTITIEEGEYLYSPLHVQSQDHSHSIYMYFCFVCRRNTWISGANVLCH